MHVELSRFIERDLQEIGDYIAKHNPTRALSFVEEIEEKIQSIGDNPLIYRLRPEIGPEARGAVHGRYLILFRLMDNYIFVERVVNGARDLSRIR
jgi:toxin ParE1/3/4